ncbi:hypothetical protein VQ056_06435 [Paenibacillus sp. JTLBN-2024]
MYKMLIVEDDPKIADLLKAHIEKYGGYGHVIRQNSTGFWNNFSSHSHIVLLDINLPSFGRILLRRLPPDPASVDLPDRFSSRPGRRQKWISVMALENGADRLC